MPKQILKSESRFRKAKDGRRNGTPLDVQICYVQGLCLRFAKVRRRWNCVWKKRRISEANWGYGPNRMTLNITNTQQQECHKLRKNLSFGVFKISFGSEFGWEKSACFGYLWHPSYTITPPICVLLFVSNSLSVRITVKNVIFKKHIFSYVCRDI